MACITSCKKHIKFCPFIIHHIHIWHLRLWLPSNSRLYLLNKYPSGVSYCPISHCSVCPIAKQRKLSFNSSDSSWEHLSIYSILIYGDLIMLIRLMDQFFSHHGRLFLADLFGFIWWNPKLKHENFFHKFHCLVNTQFHTKVKILRSDNGLEFDMPAVLWFPRHYSSKNLRWNSTTK